MGKEQKVCSLHDHCRAVDSIHQTFLSLYEGGVVAGTESLEPDIAQIFSVYCPMRETRQRDEKHIHFHLNTMTGT